MTTENHGWYQCPGCGRRTEARDDSGEKPLCERCDPDGYDPGPVPEDPDDADPVDFDGNPARHWVTEDSSGTETEPEPDDLVARQHEG